MKLTRSTNDGSASSRSTSKRAFGSRSVNWIRSLITLITILTLAAAFTTCGDSSTGPDSSGDPDNGAGNGDGGDEEPATDEVSIANLAFGPSNLTVETGTTVTWTNRDNVIHTVTSGADRVHNDLLDSGNLGPGASFSYTFEEAGSYLYFCRPQVGMFGTVTVEDPCGDDDIRIIA